MSYQNFGASKGDPPSNWAHATNAGENVYFLANNPQSGKDVIVWHWCLRTKLENDIPRWSGAVCSLHTLELASPLTLSPSLACADCENHGYIRNGIWESV